jgi:hypothetical protein
MKNIKLSFITLIISTLISFLFVFILWTTSSDNNDPTLLNESPKIIDNKYDSQDKIDIIDRIHIKNTLSIDGKILDINNSPICDVICRLIDGNGNELKCVTSNHEGYFIINLQKFSPKLHIILTKEYYLPKVLMVDYNKTNSVKYGDITLRKTGVISIIVQIKDNTVSPIGKLCIYSSDNNANDNIVYSDELKSIGDELIKNNIINNSKVLPYSFYDESNNDIGVSSFAILPGKYYVEVSAYGYPKVKSEVMSVEYAKENYVNIVIEGGHQIKGDIIDVHGDYVPNICVVACPIITYTDIIKEGKYKLVNKIETKQESCTAIAEPLFAESDKNGKFIFNNVVPEIYYSIYIKPPSSVIRVSPSEFSLIVQASDDLLTITVKRLPILDLTVNTGDEILANQNGDLQITTIGSKVMLYQDYKLEKYRSIIYLKIPDYDTDLLIDDIDLIIRVCWDDKYIGKKNTKLPRGFDRITETINLTKAFDFNIIDCPFELEHYSIIESDKVYNNSLSRLPQWEVHPFGHLIKRNPDGNYKLIMNVDLDRINKLIVWSGDFRMMKEYNVNDKVNNNYIKYSTVDIKIKNAGERPLSCLMNAYLNDISDPIWYWNIHLSGGEVEFQRPNDITYEIIIFYYENSKKRILCNEKFVLTKNKSFSFSI